MGFGDLSRAPWTCNGPQMQQLLLGCYNNVYYRNDKEEKAAVLCYDRLSHVALFDLVYFTCAPAFGVLKTVYCKHIIAVTGR